MSPIRIQGEPIYTLRRSGTAPRSVGLQEGAVVTLSAPVRLAAMMFLQYGGLGAWIVPLARWLDQSPAAGGLGFSHQQIGWIYSTLAVGSIVAPLITGILADRTFASEKLIGVINLALAALALLAGFWCRSHSGADADRQAAFAPLCLILLTY